MIFAEFLAAVHERRPDDALSIMAVALTEGSLRGVPPEDVLTMSFEDVADMISEKPQVPGFDLTVWGAGFANSQSDGKE